MRKRTQPESSSSSSSSSSASKSEPRATDEQIKTSSNDSIHVSSAKRSGLVWTVVFATLICASYGVYYYQYEHMPPPLTAEQAGRRGFSELEAMKHVKALTQLGPHAVGSDALDRALQYVLAASQKIKESKHWEADVEVDFFHAKSGANRVGTGVFKGKTLIYSDLNHIVLRILPKYASEAGENAILVSSHIDTVSAGEGAGDCSSCVAVMLELARVMSQWAHEFKNAVIFLFNTGEEDGLNGAHSFVTQHPWSTTIRVAVDLEAMGIGGRSALFQAGPNLWAVENFAAVAKYPSGQIIGQDLFASGVFETATDFQVYTEVAGLSGLDFAYTDKSAVYHTKGKYMVLYHQHFANMLHNSVILQSLLIWTASLVMGGYPAAVSLALTCLSAILMLVLSISFSVVIAFILPQISSSPVPYVASPWLTVGLFAAPAFLGALTGQHLGYIVLKAYLANQYSKRMQLSPVHQAALVKLEAERWLFKSGFLQWLILLALGNYYKIGSTYMALIWLVPPAFAYGFLEATLTPVRLTRPLKLATLLLGLAVPVLVSAGNIIRLANVLVATLVRFDRNPGGTPEWLGNVIFAVVIAVVSCLTLVYLLSYVHLSGAKGPIAFASFILVGLSIIMVSSGIIPPFSEETARAVNIVHVVDASGKFGGKQEPSSYIALYSATPGKLTKEVEQIKEGFVCGRDNVIDFVTSSMKYGCLTDDNSEGGWSQSDIPTIHVNSDTVDTEGDENERITQVSIDMKGAKRLTLAINAKEIEDFTFKVGSEELVPRDAKSSIYGWHIIEFSGGKNAASKFEIALYWAKNSTRAAGNSNGKEKQEPLVKLRTDFDRLTPKTERVLSKLPPWCSLFEGSISSQPLSFLNSLPVNF